ncbi:hypothetical protein ACTFIV_006274 [Dictyostelium citrinum]
MNNFNIITIMTFIFFFWVSESINPPISEYNCFVNLVKKLNIDISYIPLNSTNNLDICKSIKCNDTTGSIIGEIKLVPTKTSSTESLKSDDLVCMPFFTSLYVDSISLNPDDILYYYFPFCKIVRYKGIKSGISQGITKPLPPYNNLLIDTDTLNNKTLKLSYINGISSFILTGSFVRLERDPETNFKNSTSLSISCLNYPDLSGITASFSFNFIFNQYFDRLSISNYSTISNLELFIRHDSIVPFYFQNNLNIEKLTIISPLEKFTSMINFNNKTFSYLNIGGSENIHYNGEIPFSNITIKDFTFIGGNLTKTPSYFPNCVDCSHRYKANSLTVELGNFTGIASSLSFTNNKLKGTIDESYCNTQLIVQNNLLIGKIPSCFACYFNSTKTIDGLQMFDRFKDNFFENLDRSYICKSFEPRVSLINDGTYNKLLINGRDIGFDIDNTWFLNQSIAIKTNTIRVGKEYLGIIQSENNLKDVDYFSILFTLPFRVEYTFPVVKKQPIISQVNVVGLNFELDGYYFSSYQGYENQTINIEGINCIIYLTSFYSISCRLEYGLENKEQEKLLTLEIGEFKNSVFINSTSGIVSNKTCHIDCDKNICNLIKGQCQAIQHYITAVEPSTINGGIAKFYGVFGESHSFLSLSIGGIDCPVNIVGSNLIICIAPKGTGKKTVILNQNNQTFIGIDIYIYSDTIISCPNDCFKNGVCNNGQCICNSGYNGYDCSVKSDGGDNGVPPTNTTIDGNTGGTNVTNQEVNFQIYFKSLIEVDFNGETVQQYHLENNWKVNDTKDGSFAFIQTIQSGCSIISTIEEITNKDGREYEFADTHFQLNYGSLKFTISIKNYQYKNILNTLKLQIVSSVEQLNKNQNNECNQLDTSINIDNVLNQPFFNFITISKNSKVLQGRFLNKIISDGRVTLLTTNITKEENFVLVSLNLPHCVRECIVDPDFSLLVETDTFKDNCNSSPSRKWLIPVIIVASVIGAVLIILIYK